MQTNGYYLFMEAWQIKKNDRFQFVDLIWLIRLQKPLHFLYIYAKKCVFV